MNNKLSGWDDTIVALATAPGVSAIAVIRISGNEALRIIEELTSEKISSAPSHTAHYTILHLNGEKLDEVVVTVFRNPKSFTGEDVVEISCHGSPFIQQRIIEACVMKGARVARAGEFTQRAFLNGKMDLVQAEAIGDLIVSNTLASQRAAMHNVRGGFSKTLHEMRERLIQFSALLELELDFAMEDVEFADRTRFYALLEDIQREVERLMRSFALGNVIKNGISVAIIGKPNAGKSTLLNELLNEDRAIVSEIAGTTRDTIEEVINIHGVLFRLIDTAGIRAATDTIESIGVEKSMEKMRSADVIIYLVDASSDYKDEVGHQEALLQQMNKKYLVVGNKSDLAGHSADDLLNISAKQQIGIDELKQKLYDTVVHEELSTESTIITNARHYDSLSQIDAAINDIRKGLDENLPGDLLSSDVRRALYYLGEITGEITNEDKLDYIFSKFCIGK